MHNFMHCRINRKLKSIYSSRWNELTDCNRLMSPHILDMLGFIRLCIETGHTLQVEAGSEQQNSVTTFRQKKTI